jgi:hypothetical protein
MIATTPRIAAQDTNLLLLSLVADTDPSLISRWKRVNLYDFSDLELLNETLRAFSSQRTTPHVLAEVSNFVDQAPPYARAALIRAFTGFAGKHPEIYEEAMRLIRRPEFARLALADTGLVSLSKETVILTTDWELAQQIATSGGHVINFNHLRGQRLIPR